MHVFSATGSSTHTHTNTYNISTTSNRASHVLNRSCTDKQKQKTHTKHANAQTHERFVDDHCVASKRKRLATRG